MQNSAPEAGGASKAARARAESLEPKRRSEIASGAARERWRRARGEAVLDPENLRAEFAGNLEIGDLVLPCAVLNNGVRVLSERGVTQALGGKRGGSHWQRQRDVADGSRLPVFASAPNLLPFIKPSLRIALTSPLRYRGVTGGSKGFGFEATLLPEICEVYLTARRHNALQPRQAHLAAKAEILMSALAQVGIIALVDEATGFQEVRDRHELQRILEAYISRELLPWTRRFPDEFYEEMFRLRGWSYSPPQPNRPKLVGKLTKELVYEKLPKGVLEELKQRNPVVRNGWRAHKHHQFLTGDVGNPHLERQIVAVTTLMKAAPNWHAFKKMYARAFPNSDSSQLELDLGADD